MFNLLAQNEHSRINNEYEDIINGLSNTNADETTTLPTHGLPNIEGMK